MTDEEMNKKMEFIVEHQAKFATELEVTRERQAVDTARLEEQDRKLTNAVIGLIDIVARLTRAQTESESKVSSLADDIKRLVEVQARTDERLNIFINVVERYIGGNGGAESSA